MGVPIWRGEGSPDGFPLDLPIEGENPVTLALAEPGIVNRLNPRHVGLAIVDRFGHPRAAWGLATRHPDFANDKGLAGSPLSELLDEDSPARRGSIYREGCRFFCAPLAGSGSDLLVLLIEAREEFLAKEDSARTARTAAALKRLGKTLTMNQTLEPLCVAVAHEVASAADLAAVLVWKHSHEERRLDLVASVGANRRGVAAVAQLSPDAGSGCVAELVAASRQAFHLDHVADHLLTSQLEAKFCYLPPGGMSVYPLVSSDHLLGVLELIGRDGDPHFGASAELFQTLVEHFSLALHSAEMFENFERLASRDPLTGLANHRALHEFLQNRLQEAQRVEQELAVIMVDVDHFRSFNEEEGHDAGDDVLRLVSEALRSCLRPYDLAGRYGGEEFTVIMPGTSRAGVLAAAERMRKKIAAIPYVTRSGRERHVTASFGCAIYPETATDGPGLLKAADTAMYEAKRGGRNQVVFFEGRFHSSPRPEPVPLERLEEWLDSGERAAAHDRLARRGFDIDTLATSLRLSDAQRSILRALLLIAPSFRDASAERRAAMERAEEFRMLMPTLGALDERFDGGGAAKLAGTRIPLLARVLAVLMSLEEDGGASLLEEPERYDPEVVAILSDLNRSAA